MYFEIINQYGFNGSSKQEKTHKQSQPNQNNINLDVDKKLKILIVEDEILVAENLKEALQEAGYIVTGMVLSGEEAVKKCSELDPDVVIMDVKLSGKLDGINAASLIHKGFKQIPMVFMSAYSADQFPQVLNLSPGSYVYLNKPFDFKNLPKSIERLLKKSDQNT